MPAVHTKTLLAPVETVGLQNLVQPKERRCERTIALTGHIEVPGSSEIVLGTRATNRRVFIVAVEIELDLPLAPPAGVIDAPGYVCSDIMATPLDTVKDSMHLAVGEWVATPPLSVEVC